MRTCSPYPVCRALAFLLVAACATLFITAQSTPVPNRQLVSKELNARVDALLRKMTLNEKIGQLAQFSAGFATGPGAAGVNQHFDQMAAKGQVGSFFNVVGAEATNHYQHIAMEQTRLHIPLIFGLDVIHGHRTTFPIPLAVAASFDPEMAEIVARTGAVEARADGVPWVFSPMVDIARDPRWGRIVESNGEDPYLSSALARAWVRGYQQGDLSKPDSVAVSVKHFAAYGAAIGGRDYNATDMSQITLRQVYLKPYQAAVEEGAATLMSSFNSINGIPATADPLTLTQILRHEWGFDGFVVSDWGAVGELINHSIGDGPTVARKALEAGLDMDMQGNLFGTVLADQVRSGKIPESVVDQAVRRILRVKFALGLFDHPYTQPSAPYEPTAEKRALTRKVADETLVLLKNDPIEGSGTLLPLTGKAKTIALIGPMADNQRDLLGAWSAGDPKYVITLRKALEERLGADHVLYSEGCGLLSGQDEVVLNHVNFGGSAAASGSNAVPDDDKTITEAVDTAKKADLALLALGESANWMEGEASSRVHLGFTGNQQRLLEAVVATGKPVVLIVLAGRPLEIKWAAEHVPAILEAWSPGFEGGHAITDILFGDVNPSGKLPASLPRAVGQEPLYYAQMPTGRPAGNADLSHMPTDSLNKFLSRYVDEENSAIFPFGWGLSYTRFSFSAPTVSRAAVPVSEVLAASHKPVVQVGVDVKNTGTVAGTEVVQMYIRNTDASVEQPVRELKGFARVTLQPGESKHVKFPLGFNELNFYNVDLKQVVEPTTYRIWVGGSSLATAETSLKTIE
ncbi:MAG TPA: beta-glucosidase BglX [Terracidiphilus sp.]|jgi:beta-glucosidase|nr:beta-glucosidase BglX [Terracidiphilus sp.]